MKFIIVVSFLFFNFVFFLVMKVFLKKTPLEPDNISIIHIIYFFYFALKFLISTRSSIAIYKFINI